MHRLLIFFISLLCLISIIIPGEAVMIDRVLAMVNNEVVTLSDYRQFILRSGALVSSEAVDENLLKNLIDERIILIEAKKAGVDASGKEIAEIIREYQRSNNLSEEEIQQRLAEKGMSRADYENLIKQNTIAFKFVDREINRKIVVTDKEIEAYYHEHKRLFIEKPERMQIKAVFLKNSAQPTLTEITDLKLKSLKIMSEIRRGETFEKLITLYADEPLRSNNGLLGEFEEGTLITELNRTASSLKEGEVGNPVWTKEGVYILKMIKKMNESFIPLSQAKEQISRTLYQQKRENKYNEWLKLLWERSSVIIK